MITQPPTRRRLLLGAAALAAAPSRAAPPPRLQVLADALTIPGLARTRTLRVVVPPSYGATPSRRYPVLYLHDGQNLFDAATAFKGEWGVDESLDALARETGFEAIAVGIDHGGERRVNEMSPWSHPRFGPGEGDAYLDFVVGTVKPFVDGRWRTRPEAAATLIGGSSMGGLISHYAIHRHPTVFGRALVFSPAYWVAPPMAGFVRDHPLPAGARVYLHAGGREDSEMLPEARRLHALLRAQPAASTLVVAPDGRHDETAWRAAFAPALRWLFELR